MRNAVLLIGAETPTPNLREQIKAARAAASGKTIAVLCESVVRRLSRDELEELAQIEVVLTPYPAKGEACAALLAAEWIDNDEELILLSGEEEVFDLAAFAARFRVRGLAAGLIARPFDGAGANLRVDARGQVMEASCRRPVGEFAASGAFWFARGRDFVAAAKDMIRKTPNQAEPYSLAPALNELVLKDRAIGVQTAEAA
jgi:hypothetical protein